MIRSWLPILYRDFYDLPRLIAVEYSNALYLFDSPFEDAIDEYSEVFTVYRLPLEARKELAQDSWDGLTSRGEIIGHVSASDLELDTTKRRLLGDAIFDQIL